MKKNFYKFWEKGGWIPLCLLIGVAFVFFEDHILEPFLDYIIGMVFAKSEKLGILLMLLLFAVMIYVICSSISKGCKIDPDYKAKIDRELKPFVIPFVFICVVGLILFCTILFE